MPLQISGMATNASASSGSVSSASASSRIAWVAGGFRIARCKAGRALPGCPTHDAGIVRKNMPVDFLGSNIM